LRIGFVASLFVALFFTLGMFLFAQDGGTLSATVALGAVVKNALLSPWYHYTQTPGREFRAIGKSLCAEGRWEEALAAYETISGSTGVLQEPVAEDEIYNEMGFALVQLGRKEDAAHAFQAALTAKPTAFNAAYNLAGLNRELGHRKKALAAYDLIIALRDHCEPHRRVGKKHDEGSSSSPSLDASKSIDCAELLGSSKLEKLEFAGVLYNTHMAKGRMLARDDTASGLISAEYNFKQALKIREDGAKNKVLSWLLLSNELLTCVFATHPPGFLLFVSSHTMYVSNNTI
jgi:tetratricopeptide (TPR) repeat protein